MRAGNVELTDDIVQHILKAAPARVRVRHCRMVSHAFAHHVHNLGLDVLMVMDISSSAPHWFEQGLVISTGWISSQPWGSISTATYAHLGPWAADPRFSRYAFLAPRMLATSLLMAAVKSPAQSIGIIQPLLEALPSVQSVYFADHEDVKSCRGHTCAVGYIPARTTYARVVAQATEWKPAAATLSQLGNDAPPTQLTLMVARKHIGCPCGNSAVHQCAHAGCTTKCCADCVDSFSELGDCGQCQDKVCYGHSAVCVRCRARFCAGKECIRGIREYCNACYQPLCVSCVEAGWGCPLCEGGADFAVWPFGEGEEDGDDSEEDEDGDDSEEY